MEMIKKLLRFSIVFFKISTTFAARNSAKHRGVAEWSNAAVLKTVVPQGTGGSNPSSSANTCLKPLILNELRVFYFTLVTYQSQTAQVKIDLNNFYESWFAQ